MALLLGCSKPAFVYDPEGTPALSGVRALASDPRQDLVFLLEGKRAANAGPLREVAMKELEGKGYQILPSEEAAKADLWVDVIAFVDAGRGPSEGSGRSGHGGRRGMGGHPGGLGGGRGGMSEGGPSGGSARMMGTAGSEGMAGAHFQPNAGGPGLVYVVQLVEPKTGNLVWYGRMDVATALKDHGADRAQTLQEQIHRFLVPLPAATPAAR